MGPTLDGVMAAASEYDTALKNLQAGRNGDGGFPVRLISTARQAKYHLLRTAQKYSAANPGGDTLPEGIQMIVHDIESELSELTRRGRPTLPDGGQMADRTVKMDADRWEWARAQPGGAAAYIRGLIDLDRTTRP